MKFINIIHSLCPCLHHFTEADFEKYQKKYDDKNAQVSPSSEKEETPRTSQHSKIANQMVADFL
jgi:CCR4-NOT transcriptional regulation complex NOT5 subunit